MGIENSAVALSFKKEIQIFRVQSKLHGVSSAPLGDNRETQIAHYDPTFVRISRTLGDAFKKLLPGKLLGLTQKTPG
jgi:hypothetical protein